MKPPQVATGGSAARVGSEAAKGIPIERTCKCGWRDRYYIVEGQRRMVLQQSCSRVKRSAPSAKIPSTTSRNSRGLFTRSTSQSRPLYLTRYSFAMNRATKQPSPYTIYDSTKLSFKKKFKMIEIQKEKILPPQKRGGGKTRGNDGKNGRRKPRFPYSARDAQLVPVTHGPAAARYAST